MIGEASEPGDVLDVFIEMGNQRRVGFAELTRQPLDGLAVAAREHVEVREVARHAGRESLAELVGQQRGDLLDGALPRPSK